MKVLKESKSVVYHISFSTYKTFLSLKDCLFCFFSLLFHTSQQEKIEPQLCIKIMIGVYVDSMDKCMHIFPLKRQEISLISLLSIK